jgi:hypothetical protein
MVPDASPAGARHIRQDGEPVRIRVLSFLAAFLAAAMPAVRAQGPTGKIHGTVVEQSTREPVPGAIITLLDTGIGAAADAEGLFSLTEVPAGTYRVRVSAVGKKPVILPDIVVASGRNVDLLVPLEESVITVEEVVTEASTFQRSAENPVSLQRLSYEEIRRFPGGFEDVVRAVSVLPGVAQAEPGRNDLVVRGGAPSENLFVIDNIDVPNINHFGTQGSSGGPLSFINLDFVRETAFATGGFGVRYGNRLSSVLTIDLQDGREDAVGGKATVSASQFGLNLQGPLTDDATFIFSARRSYLDLIFRAAGFSFVPEYWDFLGRVSYRLDPANSLTFLAIGAIDDVSFFNDNADDRFDNSTILGSAQRQYVSGVTWQHLVGNGYSRVTLGRTFRTFNDIQRDPMLLPTFTNRSRESETTLRADLVFRPLRLTEVSLGGQVSRVRFLTDLSLPGFVTTFGDTLDARVNGYASTGYSASAYGQVSRRLLDRLEATIGVRVDYFGLLEEHTTVSPRASLSFNLTGATTLALTAGVYRQAPSTLWLVANPENRDLRAIRSDQYVLSLEHLLDADVRVRVEGFLKRYRDYPASVERPYLVLANTGAGYGGSEDNFSSFGLERLVSAGTGRSNGIELLVQKKAGRVPLYGFLSLTLMSARFIALDGRERAGAYDQRVIMATGGGYRFDDRWEASMKFRFASGRPVTPFRADGSQDVGAINSIRLDAAHSLDLRVDRRWNFAAWNLIVYADIQNVYNNTSGGTPRWNVREEKVEDEKNGIGILPSIGISAEF